MQRFSALACVLAIGVAAHAADEVIGEVCEIPEALIKTISAKHQTAPPQPEQRAQAIQLERQPVFLFCPHKESLSSWSLYVIVDKNDPSTPLALGLEELRGKNSKELTYRGVLSAQKDPSTQRKEIARLDASDFGKRLLEVKENNMLAINVAQTSGGLKLTIDARIGLDERFVVGGPARNHRDLILQYSNLNNCWQTKAPTLEDTAGHNAASRFAPTLTGIVFTAGATGISRIAAVDEFGSPVLLLDK